MQSGGDRLLVAAAGSSPRGRKGSDAGFTWRQAPGGKWVRETSNRVEGNPETTSANPLYSPPGIDETPNTFLCGVCDTTLHFQIEHYERTCCCICGQVCGAIYLTCDICGLCICCDKIGIYVSVEGWKPSCYNSFFDAVGPVREQYYNNRQSQVSEFNTNDQHRWLQCMWHDIVHDLGNFRTELQHATRVNTIHPSNIELIRENLGVEMTKNLVRLFVIFQTKVDLEIVKWFSILIENDRESFGGVALESAVRLNGRLEQMKWLMHTLELNCSNCQLAEALGIAAKLGKMNELECLVNDAALDPSVSDNFAVQVASLNGHLNIVERLLQDDRVDPSACNNAAIGNASWNGNLNVVERLLQDNRVDPSAANNSAIRDSSIAGHGDVVERLLRDDRVDPTANDNYAIRYASRNGHFKVVELLLQGVRVDPTAGNNIAIQWASKDGHLSVVERLLQDNRVDPSARDNYAIRVASKEGHLSVVGRLLQDGRVDPAAHQWEAIRTARNERVLQCLFDQTRISVCYMISDEQLMNKLTSLHNDSLVMGGLCLSRTTRISAILPQDVIFVILMKWTTLKA